MNSHVAAGEGDLFVMPLDRARAQWCLYLLTMFNSQGAMDSFQVDSMIIENCLLVKKR